jgi:hypothetical protein
LLNRGEFGFDSLDGLLLSYKITSDEDRGRNEVGFESALALVVVVGLRPDEFAVLVFDLEDFTRLCARLPAIVRRSCAR